MLLCFAKILQTLFLSPLSYGEENRDVREGGGDRLYGIIEKCKKLNKKRQRFEVLKGKLGK